MKITQNGKNALLEGGQTPKLLKMNKSRNENLVQFDKDLRRERSCLSNSF